MPDLFLFIFRIVQTGTTSETTISTVKIQSLEKHNYGDYFCKATNKVGSAEARLNLFGNFNSMVLDKSWKIVRNSVAGVAKTIAYNI